MSRLSVHQSVHLDPSTDIEAVAFGTAPLWLRLAGQHVELAVHLGLSDREIVATADRLTAATAEIRAAAVERLGGDPAAADLAAGDHFAGMPHAGTAV